MQEKRKDPDYIVKKIHVKPINLTIKHGTNSLKIFADMETPTNFRQDDYAITKQKNKRQATHSKDLKRITEHIINIILELLLKLKSDPPPWILKRVRLESSGQKLISSNGK